MSTLNEPLPADSVDWRTAKIAQELAEKKARVEAPRVKIDMGTVFGGVLLANLVTAVIFSACYYLVTH